MFPRASYVGLILRRWTAYLGSVAALSGHARSSLLTKGLNRLHWQLSISASWDRMCSSPTGASYARGSQAGTSHFLVFYNAALECQAGGKVYANRTLQASFTHPQSLLPPFNQSHHPIHGVSCDRFRPHVRLCKIRRTCKAARYRSSCSLPFPPPSMLPTPSSRK